MKEREEGLPGMRLSMEEARNWVNTNMSLQEQAEQRLRQADEKLHNAQQHGGADYQTMENL